MKEKIKFKDYSTIHKVMLPAWYSMVALCAVLTAYAIKNNKSVKEPASVFATLAVATPLYHISVRNETRQMKERD